MHAPASAGTTLQYARARFGQASVWALSGGFGAGALLLIVAYFAIPSVDAKLAVYQLFGVGAVIAIVVGVRRYRPKLRRHWWLFAGAVGLWTAGDAYWNCYRWVIHAQAPYPSPADMAYLAAYPVAIAGVLVLGRGWGRPRIGDVLDGAIVAVPAALLSLLILLEPTLGAAGTSTFGTAVAVSTPVFDVLLLTALTQIAFRGRSPNFALRCVLLSCVAHLAGDSIYSYLNLTGSYTTGMGVDAFWLVSYALWGAAALHPSMASIRTLSKKEGDRLSFGRTALLFGAVLAAPVALLVEAILGKAIQKYDLGIVAIITTLLVGIRGALIQRERTRAETALLVSEQRYRELFQEAERARVALEAHNEQLQELDHLKDNLVALVSHELRTPLTSVVGYLELVLEGDDSLTGEQRNFLGVVDRNANRLLSLVSDLLLVAQIQAGRLVVERDRVSVDEIVREAVAGALPQADNRSVSLSVDALDPADVTGDRQRLGQVLDNQISNAIKFTPEGGQVAVSASVRGDEVRIRVSDTGMGIPAAETERMFERFFRTSTATEKAIQGTGLGLWITKAIVDAHGGKISFRSTEHEGTTFEVDLPVAAAAASREPTILVKEAA
jgi:signal transduction histidine kinase